MAAIQTSGLDVETLETQLGLWGKQLDLMVVKTEGRGKDDHVDYAARIDDLRAKRQTVRAMLDEYIEAGEAPPAGGDPAEFYSRFEAAWSLLEPAFRELFR